MTNDQLEKKIQRLAKQVTKLKKKNTQLELQMKFQTHTLEKAKQLLIAIRTIGYAIKEEM